MEFYTAEEQNEILKFVGKCMKLKNIGFSEVMQTKKHSYHMYSLIGGFWTWSKENQPSNHNPRELDNSADTKRDLHRSNLRGK